jgi:hypothetical protein
MQKNEIVVVNITHVAAGAVTGGYAIALAHETWFQDSPRIPEKGQTMPNQTHDTSEDALRALVVDHFPKARLTFEIVQALDRHLPFESVEQVQRALKDLKVVGPFLDKGIVERFAAKELLPIKDTNDLIRKVAGVLNIVAQLGREGTALSGAAARVVAELNRAPGSGGEPIPTQHFPGPSIFGSTPAKGS